MADEFKALREQARHNWGWILPHFGFTTKQLSGKHGPCPFCAGRDRFRWTNFDGSGGYICSKCGNGDGFTLVMRRTRMSFSEAHDAVLKLINNMPDAELKKVQYPNAGALRHRTAREFLWKEQSKPVERGDPVDLYLADRGITLPDEVIKRGMLRYCPRCRYDKDEFYPAMLAAVIDPITGKVSQLHRTYLDPQSRSKAKVKVPRKYTPGSMPPGMSVQLFAPPQHWRGGALGVAEGIETALAAHQLFGIPVWACLSAIQMHKWVLPPRVRKAVVFADGDDNFTGQVAAYSLANRLVIKDECHVDVEVPPIGSDWNDILLEQLSGGGAGTKEEAQAPRAIGAGQ